MMQQRKRKRDKKQVISILRKFINGEDIAADLLPISYDLSKLTTDQLEELRLIEDDSERATRYKAMIDKPFSWMCETIEGGLKFTDGRDSVLWPEIKTYEKKTYPDPEIEGVSYNDPANVPVIEEKTTIPNERTIEARKPKPLTRAQEQRLFLQAKLMEFAEQERLDLQAREQMVFWNKMNSSF